ncbi:MAG TPA: TonB-dependent receptor [Lysobacter sp.]
MARSYRFTLVIVGALSWGCLAAVSAAAESDPSTPVRLVVPAGKLDRALQALATQSHTQILYAPGLVEGRRATGLQVRMAPEQALSLLLEGTGLRAVQVNANTFLIEAESASTAIVPGQTQARGDTPTELATVQVTGTHIPRSSIEVVTAVPLTRITRAQIEASGFQTLFELLSYQPGMVSHHPVDVATDGGFQSQQPFAAAATTSLYGLGPRATLFLLDGRRMANYGLASADLGGLTDLNGIPLSMVERIEIIRGGASAIYGADAMAGVVNIILRKGQVGGEAVARYGLSERGDAEQRRFSFNYGQVSDDGGSWSISADYLHRDALLGADRTWRTADLRSLGLGDRRVLLAYFSSEGLEQWACPDAIRDDAGECYLDKPRYVTLQPELESTAVYGQMRQPLGDAVDLSASVRLSQVQQRLQGAPFHAAVFLPFGHPDDWFQGNATVLNYAFFDIGPVRSRSTARSADLTLGLDGYRGSWQWQADFAHHRNDVDNLIDGLVSNEVLARAIQDVSYRFNGAANPPSLLAELSPRVEVQGDAQFDQLAFSASGPWFSLPGGQTQAAVGMEWNRDALDNRPDDRMVAGDIALGAQKIDIDEHRYSSAVYAELSMPIAKWLNADLAWRVDHRQGYGTRSSPMLGLKWTLSSTLTLRGTAASGYRAPTLFELRRPTVSDSIDVVEMTDVLAPCQLPITADDGTVYCVVSLGGAENPDLQPETSRSYILGLVWAPTTEFDISLDRFRILRRNEILSTNALANPAAFPGALVRDEQGGLYAINDYFTNVGRTEVEGWELQSEYRLDTAGHGRFVLRLAASYLDQLSRQANAASPELDYAGHGAPQRSVLAGVEWTVGDWIASLNLHELGPADVAGPGEPCPRRNASVRKCRTPAWTTADLYLAYVGLAAWRLSLNINNLTDHQPVNYDPDKLGYDIAYDDPRGRYYLLSAAYRF